MRQLRSRAQRGTTSHNKDIKTTFLWALKSRQMHQFVYRELAKSLTLCLRKPFQPSTVVTGAATPPPLRRIPSIWHLWTPSAHFQSNSPVYTTATARRSVGLRFTAVLNHNTWIDMTQCGGDNGDKEPWWWGISRVSLALVDTSGQLSPHPAGKHFDHLLVLP